MFKVIIFDFDGTLHNGENWENWFEYMQEALECALPNMTLEERNTFLRKYGIDPQDPLTADVAVAMIKEFGSAQKLVDFHMQNLYRLNYPNMKFVDPEFIKNLSKHYRLYIVSNSPVSAIERHLTNWGIAPTIFRKIYFNQFLPADPTKAVFYKEIMDIEKVAPEEMLVIGDNLRDDLLPAQKLNIPTFQTRELNDIYTYFENLEKEQNKNIA